MMQNGLSGFKEMKPNTNCSYLKGNVVISSRSAEFWIFHVSTSGFFLDRSEYNGSGVNKAAAFRVSFIFPRCFE